ncbi:MAG: c-type cytochrome [Xanthomonadales bacterium]|nr:c-type cytochrome [Xanthomonadales bacterium]
MSRFPKVSKLKVLTLMLLLAAVSATTAVNAKSKGVGHYGYGKAASTEEIAGWDIDIRPDGRGLPAGSGSVEDGEILYEDQCASCHGSFGEGVGKYPVLAGGEGTLTEERPEKTVGSFWAHTSTLFDYIRRAMPFPQPASLSDDETYAITAYVLYLNDLVEDDFVLSQETWDEVAALPNHSNFVADPRPDTQAVRCMKNCKKAVKIVSEPTISAEEVAAADDTIVKSDAGNQKGASVYNGACAACHNLGVAGAPKLGDKAIWKARLALGEVTLIKHAIEGFQGDAGMMPPKGGRMDLSDEDVAAAVRFMLAEAE